jgi:hypothetical protein
MSKRLNAQTSKSPFADILGRHKEARGELIAPAPAAPAPAGRKLGKSADPAFTKLTVYIREETHQAVKVRLLQEHKGTDFSELVEDLLEAWLKRHPAQSAKP